jgi:hypothetical protein
MRITSDSLLLVSSSMVLSTSLVHFIVNTLWNALTMASRMYVATYVLWGMYVRKFVLCVCVRAHHELSKTYIFVFHGEHANPKS